MKKTVMTRLALAAAVAASFGGAIESRAGVTFFNEGTGPGSSLANINFNAGNYLLQGIGPANNGNTFQFYGQTTIANFATSAGNLTASAGHEYTLVIAAPLVQSLQAANAGTGAAASLNGTLAASGTNYFEVYYGGGTAGGLTASNQNGTGFRDGKLILSGTIAAVNSFNLVNNSSWSGPLSFLKKDLQLIDSRPGGDYNNSGSGVDTARSYKDSLSINISGSPTFNVQVGFSDGAFFQNAPTFITAQFQVEPNPQVNAPHTTVAPALSFTDTGASPINLGSAKQVDFPGVALGAPPTNVGPLNLDPNITANSVVQSFRCVSGPIVGSPLCDVITQGSGSASASANSVPEPGSLGLLGLGLGVFGVIARRARRQA